MNNFSNFKFGGTLFSKIVNTFTAHAKTQIIFQNCMNYQLSRLDICNFHVNWLSLKTQENVYFVKLETP